MNKNDLRYKKTHNLIISTFLKCVDEIGFDKTSISEICNRAMISRKAFYAHFKDKYDLLDYIYEELRNSYKESLSQEMLKDISEINIKSGVKWNIQIAAKHKDLIRALLKTSNNQLKSILINSVVIYPNHLLIENYEEVAKDIKLQINFNYMTYAMIGFFEVWLNNFDSISLDEAEQLMYDLCFYPSSLYQEKLQSHPDVKFRNE